MSFLARGSHRIFLFGQHGAEEGHEGGADGGGGASLRLRESGPARLHRRTLLARERGAGAGRQARVPREVEAGERRRELLGGLERGAPRRRDPVSAEVERRQRAVWRRLGRRRLAALALALGGGGATSSTTGGGRARRRRGAAAWCRWKLRAAKIARGAVRRIARGVRLGVGELRQQPLGVELRDDGLPDVGGEAEGDQEL